MIRILLTLLLTYFFVSLCIRWKTHDCRFHLLFPIHFSLALITAFICGTWFLTGREFVFDYGSLWGCIQRGSLEALSAPMSIVGVGSVLLGWTYGERDKRTLGKRQVDMVHHFFGHGYTISLIVHIVSTVLCLIMLKCASREASLWSFVTVFWGFVSQAIVCLFVTLNRKKQESLALALWETDRRGKDTFQVIQNMVEYLSDADVRCSKAYRTMLGSIFVIGSTVLTTEHAWITAFPPNG